MSQQTKVIHIELNEPYLGKRHYYYGSKAAIFDELPELVIGIKKESLWNVDLGRKKYQNKFCTIRMGILRRKQSLKDKTEVDLIKDIAKKTLESVILNDVEKQLSQVEDELNGSADMGKVMGMLNNIEKNVVDGAKGIKQIDEL